METLTGEEKELIGIITPSKAVWLLTPKWYMIYNDKHEDVVAKNMWDIWSHGMTKDYVLIYTPEELVKWIIRGNPNI